MEQRNIYGVDAGSSDITAAVTGQRTVSAQMLAALHDQPVAAQLGATMVQASGAHFLVPFLGSMIPSTADEGGSLSSSASFSQLDLTPTRYGRRADITTLALRAGRFAIVHPKQFHHHMIPGRKCTCHRLPLCYSTHCCSTPQESHRHWRNAHCASSPQTNICLQFRPSRSCSRRNQFHRHKFRME